MGVDGGPVRIDILSWLSRTTLDIIGLAGNDFDCRDYKFEPRGLLYASGFNYEFNALNVNEKPNELNEAFSTIFNMESGITLIAVLQELLPVLRKLVRNTAKIGGTMLTKYLANGKAENYGCRDENYASSWNETH